MCNCQIGDKKIYYSKELIDKVTYEVNCYVTGVEQLNKMVLALEKNQFVEKVERVMR